MLPTTQCSAMHPKSIWFHLSRYCASDLSTNGHSANPRDVFHHQSSNPANLHTPDYNNRCLRFDRRCYCVLDSRWRVSNETFSWKRNAQKRTWCLQIEVNSWDKQSHTFLIPKEAFATIICKHEWKHEWKREHKKAIKCERTLFAKYVFADNATYVRSQLWQTKVTFLDNLQNNRGE